MGVQVPFALDNNADRTFVSAAETDLVQISGQPGADKRFGTLQVASGNGALLCKVTIVVLV
jgi:hypothetical protein